jgi:two-component system cell cycle response regulator
VLRRSFRSSDVVARLGGDEFVVLADDVGPERSELLLARLRGNVDAHVADATRPFRLSLAIGAVLSEHGESLDELLRRADAAMYACKRARRASQPVAAPDASPPAI